MPELARQTTAFGTGLALPAGRCTSGTPRRRREEADAVAARDRGDGRRVVDRPRRRDAAAATDATSWSSRRTTRRCDGCATRWRRRASATSPVGTVDKFQGREAPVVFYSMATSSAEDVPRSLEFLFSRNRLNVADLARDVPRVRRGEPAAARVARAHDRADAADQRALSIRRNGRPELNRAGPPPARRVGGDVGQPAVHLSREARLERCSRAGRAPRTTATSGSRELQLGAPVRGATMVRTISPEFRVLGGQELPHRDRAAPWPAGCNSCKGAR